MIFTPNPFVHKVFQLIKLFNSVIFQKHAPTLVEAVGES
jgi:hypothetical protein